MSTPADAPYKLVQRIPARRISKVIVDPSCRVARALYIQGHREEPAFWGPELAPLTRSERAKVRAVVASQLRRAVAALKGKL